MQTEAKSFQEYYEEEAAAHVLFSFDDLAARWHTDAATIGKLLDHLFIYEVHHTVGGYRFVDRFSVEHAEKDYPELPEGRFDDAIARADARTAELEAIDAKWAALEAAESHAS